MVHGGCSRSRRCTADDEEKKKYIDFLGKHYCSFKWLDALIKEKMKKLPRRALQFIQVPIPVANIPKKYYAYLQYLSVCI